MSATRIVIKTLLDQIWNDGHTPQLVVDARSKDVIVPENIREAWGNKLKLNLLASYPLNLTTERDALRADLAFNGSVTRCAIPWERIYGVVNLDTKEAYLVQANLPEEMRPHVREAAGENLRTSRGDVLSPNAPPKGEMARYIPGMQGLMKTPEGSLLPVTTPDIEPPTRKFRVIKGGKG